MSYSYGKIRSAIREMILMEESAPENMLRKIRSTASVYREIESSQGVFKYNGSRLTLLDPASRPFDGMSREDIEKSIVSFIESAGYEVDSVIRPSRAYDGKVYSRKYNTYIVSPADQKEQPENERDHFPIVFGYAHSSAESLQVESIQTVIADLLQDQGADHIMVWNGVEYVEVDAADRVGKEGKKVDAFLTRRGVPVIGVSLKNLANGRVSGMQQWSGIQSYLTHPEVVDFIKAVKFEIEEGRRPKVWRRIEDEALKHKAMWISPNGEKADIIVAGVDPLLVPDGEGFRFDVTVGPGGASGIWYRLAGENPDGPFEPVLVARPAKEQGRYMGNIPGMRGLIMPLGTITVPMREI